MINRIHKYSVSVIDYSKSNRGDVIGKESFVAGHNLHGLFISGILSGIDITYNDVRDMIKDCRENGNVIYDVDKNTAVEVRHWSYNRKS